MKPQDLDPLCSPYTKEIWIGRNVDLDLLSNFPQEYARIMGGIKRNRKLFNRNNGGERVGREMFQGGRRPPLNSSPRIWPLGRFPARPVVPAYPAVLPSAPGQRSSRLGRHGRTARMVLPVKPNRYYR